VVEFSLTNEIFKKGTFLNHIRLSGPGLESRPFRARDGDILQLGVDYQGGAEEIYRCVKVKLELGRGRDWQRGANCFKSVPNTIPLPFSLVSVSLNISLGDYFQHQRPQSNPDLVEPTRCSNATTFGRDCQGQDSNHHDNRDNSCSQAWAFQHFRNRLLHLYGVSLQQAACSLGLLTPSKTKVFLPSLFVRHFLLHHVRTVFITVSVPLSLPFFLLVERIHD
jgi:hypothetical protein